MNTLHLPPKLYEALLAQIDELYPEEACGLIAGRGNRVVRLYPVENILHSTVAFEMKPLEQIRAMLAMEADGLELLAIYHSHPDGPARPSPSDIAQAYYPETMQIILSLADRTRPSLRAFMIREGQVREAQCLIV